MRGLPGGSLGGRGRTAEEDRRFWPSPFVRRSETDNFGASDGDSGVFVPPRDFGSGCPPLLSLAEGQDAAIRSLPLGGDLDSVTAKCPRLPDT
jgi:hypothetical protein